MEKFIDGIHVSEISNDNLNESYDGILCMEGDRRLGGVFAN